MNEIETKLLEITNNLAIELQPAHKLRPPATLDSHLDKDLGFDSLSRMELLSRIEQEFASQLGNRQLGEKLFASAETPRDLLQAITTASGATPTKQGAFSPPFPAEAAIKSLTESAAAPEQAQTLVDVLLHHATVHGPRPHIYLYADQPDPELITYRDLYTTAQQIALGLSAKKLRPQQTVAIMLPTSREYLSCFFGCLLAECIPVPIYPPTRPAQIQEHLKRHSGILTNAETTLLITLAEARKIGHLLTTHVPGLKHIVTPQELVTGLEPVASEEKFSAPTAAANDIALLQYTSGSTGNPKGVILTHRHLLANIRAMGKIIAADSTDVFVSWLPLYHDMGLIGAWLGSLYYAMPLVLMSPLSFLAHPERWLWAIHTHRGSLTAAPNFAYELCVHKVSDNHLQGLDLSCLRLASNGAEHVSPQTVRQFAQRFKPSGFRAAAMAPVYGLAEAAVGLAFPPLGREPLIDKIQRPLFEKTGRARPAVIDTNVKSNADEPDIEFVSCGQPLPGYQIRIVDSAGRELPEREEGRLQFIGPSATPGYYRNPEQSRQLFDGKWLETGDRAYTVGADIFVTGRSKEVIILQGRNIYPYEIEESIGNLPGIRKGCVAVFGSRDPESQTERLIVMAEAADLNKELSSKILSKAENAPATLTALRREINTVTADIIGMPPHDVVLLPPRSILKTSSGKIRRAACQARYERGEAEQKAGAVWWQLTKFVLAGVNLRLKKWLQSLTSYAYAAYAWGLLVVMTPLVWLLGVTLPRSANYAAVRRAIKLLLSLARVPLRLEGLNNIEPNKTYILTANHASYLDSAFLLAVLPIEFSFVAKAELQKYAVVRLFLRRVGTQFVERYDLQRGIADARRLVQCVKAGRSLLFFPEGTFSRVPGLLPFHMGAFVAAAEANVPIVPITILGSRSMLRSGSWFPRRTEIMVSIGQNIPPQGESWEAALQLKNVTREEIGRRLHEPDLERVPM